MAAAILKRHHFASRVPVKQDGLIEQGAMEQAFLGTSWSQAATYQQFLMNMRNVSIRCFH